MRLPFSEAQRAFINRLLNVLTILCGTSALALLVIVLGWPMGDELRTLIHPIGTAILTVFVVQEAIRLLIQPHPWRFLRHRLPEVILAFAAGAELLLSEHFFAWLQNRIPEWPATTLTVLYLAGTQLTVIILVVLRALRRNSLLSGRRLSPGMVFILSFAALILGGTLLLLTPQASVRGISWIDALFTATSAVCVTGLSSLDVATDFTRQGQWIILSLIQLGGLGVMTITYFFAYFFAGGISLRNRIALQDLLSEENLGQIGTVLGMIVSFTFLIEAAGALAIHTALSGVALPNDDAIFFSIFHSVSAFCNAGFSTLSGNLADPIIQGRQWIFCIIMALIILGGLGFPVMKNVWLVLIAKMRRKLHLRIAAPPRLSLNSRVVLSTTLCLLVGGTVLVWLTEFWFADGAVNGSSLVTAAFHAVTARTAGFCVTPVEQLLPATAVVIMLLMFVGGSSASTAGGIKTSTLAVAVLALRRVMLGRKDIDVYGRRLNEDLVNRALATILVAIAFITLVTIALCALHPELSPADLTFEAVSAVGTVGLTRGITPLLGTPAKLVVITAMFVGRIGVLLFFLSFISKRPTRGYRLPESTIVLS